MRLRVLAESASLTVVVVLVVHDRPDEGIARTGLVAPFEGTGLHLHLYIVLDRGAILRTEEFLLE